MKRARIPLVVSATFATAASDDHVARAFRATLDELLFNLLEYGPERTAITHERSSVEPDLGRGTRFTEHVLVEVDYAVGTADGLARHVIDGLGEVDYAELHYSGGEDQDPLAEDNTLVLQAEDAWSIALDGKIVHALIKSFCVAVPAVLRLEVEAFSESDAIARTAEVLRWVLTQGGRLDVDLEAIVSGLGSAVAATADIEITTDQGETCAR